MNKEELQKNIEAMEAELAKMKEHLNKPDMFEFKYEYSDTYYVYGTHISYDNHGKDKGVMKYGRYRKTKEVAEQALQLQKECMVIHALAEQLGGLKEFIVDKRNFYIYYDSPIKKYESYYSTRGTPIGVTYMTKECAEKICRILNAGEVVL